MRNTSVIVVVVAFLTMAVAVATSCGSSDDSGLDDGGPGGDGGPPGECVGSGGSGCDFSSEYCVGLVSSSFGACVKISVYRGAAPTGEPGTSGAACGTDSYCNEGLECINTGDFSVCAPKCYPGSCSSDQVCYPADPCGGLCLPNPDDDWPSASKGELFGECYGGTDCDEGTCIKPEDFFYFIAKPICLPLCS